MKGSQPSCHCKVNACMASDSYKYSIHNRLKHSDSLGNEEGKRFAALDCRLVHVYVLGTVHSLCDRLREQSYMQNWLVSIVGLHGNLYGADFHFSTVRSL